ncbi:unnamed protein product, partial [Symbiodinium sp. CCMP2456]
IAARCHGHWTGAAATTSPAATGPPHPGPRAVRPAAGALLPGQWFAPAAMRGTAPGYRDRRPNAAALRLSAALGSWASGRAVPALAATARGAARCAAHRPSARRIAAQAGPTAPNPADHQRDVAGASETGDLATAAAGKGCRRAGWNVPSLVGVPTLGRSLPRLALLPWAVTGRPLAPGEMYAVG